MPFIESSVQPARSLFMETKEMTFYAVKIFEKSESKAIAEQSKKFLREWCVTCCTKSKFRPRQSFLSLLNTTIFVVPFSPYRFCPPVQCQKVFCKDCLAVLVLSRSSVTVNDLATRHSILGVCPIFPARDREKNRRSRKWDSAFGDSRHFSFFP